MAKLTVKEQNEIIRKLEDQYGSDDIEALGYNRYVIREQYWVAIENSDSKTILHKEKLIDSEGNIIPLECEYNNIFAFTKGVAVVCIRDKVRLIERDGDVFSEQDKRYGLIDINGNQLLPCIYSHINVHLDGVIEISKNGQNKATSLSIILNKKFDWDDAIPRY